MKETFLGTITMYLPKLNWPKSYHPVLDNKSYNKSTTSENEAGPSKEDLKNESTTN